MEQISFFEKVKPKVIFIKDDRQLCDDFIEGAEFELYMETKEHYHILHNGVYYGTYKDNCRKVEA
nr:MAG TPA: hypothetical protein [Caudoviricetes sp.]